MSDQGNLMGKISLGSSVIVYAPYGIRAPITIIVIILFLLFRRNCLLDSRLGLYPAGLNRLHQGLVVALGLVSIGRREIGDGLTQ